jgi:hypothetical protein
MAQAGETQVYRKIPVVGDKCYEHVEATRSVNVGNGKRKYYSTNVPTYVGKFVRQERIGPYGDGQYVFDYFDDNGRETKVAYSYEGLTCFNEVPCKIHSNSKIGGRRRRRRSTRRRVKTLKSRRRQRGGYLEVHNGSTYNRWDMYVKDFLEDALRLQDDGRLIQNLTRELIAKYLSNELEEIDYASLPIDQIEDQINLLNTLVRRMNEISIRGRSFEFQKTLLALSEVIRFLEQIISIQKSGYFKPLKTNSSKYPVLNSK